MGCILLCVEILNIYMAINTTLHIKFYLVKCTRYMFRLFRLSHHQALCIYKFKSDMLNLIRILILLGCYKTIYTHLDHVYNTYKL
jgi:hypothetical protein